MSVERPLYDLREFGNTYEEICKNFVWRVPAHFNIAKRVDSIDKRKTCMLYDRSHVPYGEIIEGSNGFARLFSDLGVKKGDVIALMVQPSPRWLQAFLGALKLGAISCNFTVLLGVDGIRFRVRHSGAKLVVVDGTTSERVQEALADSHVPIIGGRGEKAVAFPAPTSSFEATDTLATDPAALLYTSGTERDPKGVLIPHSRMIADLPPFLVQSDMKVFAEDIIMTPNEWAWSGGLDYIMPVIYYGLTLVPYMRKAKFDPEDFLRSISESKATASMMFPPVIRRIVKLGRIPYELKLRVISTGGGPLFPEERTWIEQKLGVNVNMAYGQTEANVLTGSCPVIMVVKKDLENIGKPFPGHVVDILDEAGRTCPPGEIGEIALKLPDPCAMLEYYKDPEGTKARFAGGWLHTGDLGKWDQEGYVIFVSRKDDMIKSSGYRLSVEEIQEVIKQHEAVSDCAVLGIEDEARGVTVVAVIELRESVKASEEVKKNIQDFTKKRLALYAYPRVIRFVQSMPRTETGKIRKKELKRMISKTDGQEGSRL